MSTPSQDLVTTLRQRGDVLACLLAGPLDKSALSEELSVSRATIARAIDDLQEWELIDSDSEGVRLTLVGQLAVTVYDDFDTHVAAAAQETDGDSPWPTATERIASLGVLANRLEVIECVQTPRDKRTLIMELEAARSTVDRAIRELEDAGFVERMADGYTMTDIGRRATTLYHATLATLADVLAARDMLNRLPADGDLPPAVIRKATLERADETMPYHLLAGVRKRLETADRVRAVLPALPNPQLLDVCHNQVVRHGMTLRLVTVPDLADTLISEFPGRLAEMTATGGTFTAFTATAPPFGVVLTDTDDGSTVSILIYRNQQTMYDALHVDTDAAVRWAEDYYERVLEQATEITDTWDAVIETPSDHIAATDVAGVGRITHEAEGIVQLTPEYFAQHTPAPPAMAWRTGLDLVDIHAGYAIDRVIEQDDVRQSLTDYLMACLDEGVDHALIGPPGSGKSTVCRAVACQWYEHREGTVFYRQSGTGTTFDSSEILSAQLRAAVSEGHVLVVVEDAVRAEANTVFRVMKAFQENENVSFLVDARTSEWDDPSAFPADARLDAYRTETVETVTMPAFNDQDCERLVERFQEVTDYEGDIPTTHLLRGSETERDEEKTRQTQENQPAELLLVLHRLTLHADPLAGDTAQTPTTLTEDVQRTYADLRADGDMALDVGVLVNLLNAADLDIKPAIIYALAETDEEVMAVHNALTTLNGRSIFTRGTTTAENSYRVVHEAWSELFLTHLLDAAGEHAARHRIGRCITSLLALADEEARRTRCMAACGRTTPTLSRIEDAPTEWANTTIERLFHLGLNCPKLAPLFGTAENSSIELPTTCSPTMEPHCAAWRGRMYFQAGNRDLAKRELDRAVGLVDDTDRNRDQSAKINSHCHKHLGSVALRRGQIDTAEEYYMRALNSYREIGDRLGEAACHNNLGIVVYARGDLEQAEEYFERSLTIRREIGASRKQRICPLNNLGLAATRRGDFNRAAEYLNRSIEIGRDLGEYFRMGRAFYNLGGIERRRGNLDCAEEQCRQGLDITQDAGVSDLKALGLLNLGAVALERGDLNRAEKYVRRSVEIWNEIENIQHRVTGRRFLGMIIHKHDDPDDAEKFLTNTLEICQGCHPYEEAKILAELGEIALTQGDVARASERFETAMELYREMGAVRDAVESMERLAGISETLNEHETTLAYYESAAALAQKVEFDVPHEAVSEQRARLIDNVTSDGGD